MSNASRNASGAPAILSLVFFAELLCPALHAQTGPTFDVGSIKPAPDNPGPNGFRALSVGDGRVMSGNIPLRTFIETAYQVRPFQVSGGPDWIGVDRYNIDARAEGRATRDQTRKMMRTLLADRFKLALHTETRELPVYTLVAAKNGLKLPAPKPKKGECAELGPGKPLPGFKGAPLNPCGVIRGGPGTLDGDSVRFAQLTLRFSLILDRSVIDETGFKGAFNVHLKWTPDPLIDGAPAPGLPAADPDGPSLFDALEKELGLRLQSGKGPVQVLVIDHVERPSEN